jgi:peptide/nickel transport system permease protein
VAGRVGASLLVLLVLSLAVFAMVRLIPGDPAAGFFDARSAPTPEEVAQVRARLGLDRPWPQQYLSWVGGILRGDFGDSLVTPFPVGAQIAQRLPISATLAFLAMGLALGIGIPLGKLAGARAGRPADAAVRATSFALLSTPAFLVGLFLVLVNSRTLRWQMVGLVPFAQDPAGHLRMLIAPAAVLALGLGAFIARHTRAGLIDDLERPHIRTLQAIGTPRRVIVRLALRNALIPVSTVVAAELGGLIGGTVVIEKVFAIPAMGTYLVDAIEHSDYPAIQGAMLVIGAVYLLMNLLVDLAYPVIDPRVRVVAT